MAGAAVLPITKKPRCLPPCKRSHATEAGTTVTGPRARLIVMAGRAGRHMHPIISAWVLYTARLNEQPKWDDLPAWSIWLEDCIVLSDWFNLLRRLPVAHGDK